MVQSRTGWKLNYLRHDWRKEKEDFLPYQNWVEMLEVLAIEEMERRHHDFELEAFGGWQRHLCKAKKPMDFERYKKSLGLRRPIKAQGKSKKSEIAKAHQVMRDLGFTGLIRDGGVRPSSNS
jgi:hypothetical protein